MKKEEYYIHTNNGFEKVTGYVGTVKNSEGKEIKVGVHRNNYRILKWSLSELTTGCLLNHFETRQKAINSLTDEYINTIIKVLENNNQRQEELNNFLKGNLEPEGFAEKMKEISNFKSKYEAIDIETIHV